MVTLRVRVWIETRKKGLTTTMYFEVTLRVRVWIETFTVSGDGNAPTLSPSA